MVTQNLTVRCVCGWEAVGPEDELVAATQDHGRRVHNMEASREDVLAMVVPTDDAGPGASPDAGASRGTEAGTGTGEDH
jgi:predicted small metal-binding protein